METVLLILLSLFQNDVPIGLHPERQPSLLGDSPSYITVSISESCTYWATSPKTTVCTSETVLLIYCLYFRVMYLLGYIPKDNRLYSETVLLILLSLFQTDVPIGLHPQRQPSVPRRQSFSYYCLYFRVMYLLGYIPKDNRLYLGDSPSYILSLFQSDVPIGLHPQRQPSVPRRQSFLYYCLYFRVMYLLGYIPKDNRLYLGDSPSYILSLFQSDVPIGLHPQRQPPVPRRQSFLYYCLYFRVMYLLGYIPKDKRLYLGDSLSYITVSISE